MLLKKIKERGESNCSYAKFSIKKFHFIIHTYSLWNAMRFFNTSHIESSNLFYGLYSV